MAKFKGLVKSCEVCGTEFKVSQSQDRVRTCSYECGYKIRRVANKVDWVKLSCKVCGKEFSSPPSQAVSRVYCSHECKHADPARSELLRERISGEKNPSWKGGVSISSVSSSGKIYFRTPRGAEDEKVVRRKRAKDLATPLWANREKMVLIYQAAKEISSATGVKHHVDHIVPLKSDLVCGLHNEFNLRVIPAAENLRKHNRYWPDQP